MDDKDFQLTFFFRQIHNPGFVFFLMNFHIFSISVKQGSFC